MLEDMLSLDWFLPLLGFLALFGLLILVRVGRSVSKKRQKEEWQTYAFDRGFEYSETDANLSRILQTGFPLPVQGTTKHILRTRVRGANLFLYELRDVSNANRPETHALFSSPELHLPPFTLVEMQMGGLVKTLFKRIMPNGTLVEFGDHDDFGQQFTLMTLAHAVPTVKELFNKRLRSELFTITQTYKAPDIPSTAILQIIGQGNYLDFHYNGYVLNSSSRDSFLEQAEVLLRAFQNEIGDDHF